MSGTWGRPRAAVALPVVAVGVALVVPFVPACAQLLGGLDPPLEREDSRAPLPADGAAGGAACGPWLDGFRRRVAIDLDSARATPAVPVHFAIPTRAAVSAKEMRPSGADLRVTQGDGVTAVPHWLGGPAGGDATDVWARASLRMGRTRLYVYYGNDDAPAASSLRATFSDDVVANADFASGTAPWFSLPPTAGGVPSLRVGADGAEVGLERALGPGGESSTGWCQRVTFPPGEWVVVVDQLTLASLSAEPRIWADGLDGRTIWRRRSGAGLARALETEPVGPGETVLCLGGTLLPSSIHEPLLRVVYRNVRVRPAAGRDVVPNEIGSAEARCR